MDDGTMTVLQMLQDGKISAREAETLIAALRGEAAPPVDLPPAAGSAAPSPDTPRAPADFFGGLKPPKIDFDNLGDRISRAVSRVQPEKIVSKIQDQIRTATRAGANWSASVGQKVRDWADTAAERPVNSAHSPEKSDTHEQEFHLDAGAAVTIENSLGDISIHGAGDGPATLIARKMVWHLRAEELTATLERIAVTSNGTDGRLDIRTSAPEGFGDGVVDLELRLPSGVSCRASTPFGKITAVSLNGRVETVSRSGDIHLQDIGGELRAETASGSIQAERLRGAVMVATQSGAIRVSEASEGAVANSASGDVRLTDIQGGRVECKSVSGDVTAEQIGTYAPVEIVVESVSGDALLKKGRGSVSLKSVSGSVAGSDLIATRVQAQTVSGDLRLAFAEPFSGLLHVNTVSGGTTIALPEGSSLRAALTTTSGTIRCDLDAKDVVSTETLWSGELGTGEGSLNVTTISGDTRLQRS